MTDGIDVRNPSEESAQFRSQICVGRRRKILAGPDLVGEGQEVSLVAGVGPGREDAEGQGGHDGTQSGGCSSEVVHSRHLYRVVGTVGRRVELLLFPRRGSVGQRLDDVALQVRQVVVDGEGAGPGIASTPGPLFSLLGDLQAGTTLGDWTLVAVHEVYLGAIPVVLQSRDGRTAGLRPRRAPSDASAAIRSSCIRVRGGRPEDRCGQDARTPWRNAIRLLDSFDYEAARRLQNA